MIVHYLVEETIDRVDLKVVAPHPFPLPAGEG
jgi:hypothetical protein